MAVRWPQVGRTGRAGILAVMLCVASASCASQQPTESGPAADLPVDASPDQVLDAYLAAFKANDCARAAKLTVGTFTRGNGELCGAVTVESIDRPDGAAKAGDEYTYAVVLHLSRGSDDGTVPAGTETWFYIVKHQPDGSWRLASGGSGP